MQDYVIYMGMVLEATPVNDYDRRVVILTKECGKITAFCRGARRQNNKMMAVTNPFTFGKYKLIEGKNAYNLIDAEVSFYFEELRTDFVGAYLGMYFLEFTSYCTKENNDDCEMLKLLFQSIRAVIKENIDNRLVKAVFEIKAIAVNGEYPGIPGDRSFLADTLRALDFIVGTPVEHLYTFSVSEEVLSELSYLGEIYRKRLIDRNFKSLELVENCMLKI